MKNFKMKGLFTIIIAVLFNCMTGGLIAATLGAPPQAGALAMNGLGLMPQIAQWCGHTVKMAQGMFFVGLYKEVWLSALMDNFYPQSGFLQRSRDLSAFVENEKIHLGEIGAEPAVLKNNTTYPIAVNERADSALELILDTYDTENTIVRSAKDIELSYDKVASVVDQHKKAIMRRFTSQSIHAYAPSADGIFTPVIQATGANNGFGVKALKIEDIIALKVKFDALDIPESGRILVLNPQHQADLLKQDVALTKTFALIAPGQVINLYGFQIYTTSVTPRYNRATGAKVPYGTAAAGTDTIASIAYHEDEVMRCQGTSDLFFKERSSNPEQRGDVIGFQTRFLAMPIRNKALGAIYSPAA